MRHEQLVMNCADEVVLENEDKFFCWQNLYSISTRPESQPGGRQVLERSEKHQTLLYQPGPFILQIRVDSRRLKTYIK